LQSERIGEGVTMTGEPDGKMTLPNCVVGGMFAGKIVGRFVDSVTQSIPAIGLGSLVGLLGGLALHIIRRKQP
jgi:hypothetical protein